VRAGETLRPVDFNLGDALYGMMTDTNLSPALTLQRPLGRVKAAIQNYCGDHTEHPGFAPGRTNEVSGASYEQDLIDCAFDASGSLNGSVLATRITDTTTRLELSLLSPLPSEAAVASRLKRHVAIMLDEIAELAGQQP